MRPAFILVTILALCTAAYWPGLKGPFMADDMPNIVANPLVPISSVSIDSLKQAAASNRSGPLGRPLAALSFGLNYWVAGGSFDHLWFKSVNLGIHLLNTVLVFILARRLLSIGGFAANRAIWGAALATALWALHPIQLTNVLYVVQRVNSLAFVFVMSGMLVFVSGRERLANEGKGWPLMIAGVVGGVGLGVFAKENAVVLLGFVAVVELILFKGRVHQTSRSCGLALFYGTVLGLPAVIGGYVIVVELDFWSAMYLQRDFDLMQRLLSQSRVLFWFAAQTLAPNMTAMSIYHDDFIVSRSLFDPMTTLWAVTGWIAVVAMALVSLRRTPWFAFAVGWFLAGHSLEGSIVPLELLFEHRNYLPSVGACLAVAAGALKLMETGVAPVSRRLPMAMAVIMIGTLTATTASRAHLWSDAKLLIEVTAWHQPNSARAQAVRAFTLQSSGAPLDVIYAAFARASKLNPALIETRIAQLQILTYLQAQDALDTTALDTTLGDTFLAADGGVLISLTAQGLAAARTRLTENIEVQMRSGVPEVRAVAALLDLTDCILEDIPGCVSLAPALHSWIRAGEGNIDFGPYAHGAFGLMRSRLLIAGGRIDEGLAALADAIGADPQRLILRRERAAVLVMAGRFDEARRYITELEGERGGIQHARELASIKEALDAVSSGTL
ncbi:MAG: hypothetical protein GKR94_09045 [Gammaproteobacteria bacterium]|nr:hypothetical protein [Gammaproteobacteria bacterium]